MSRQESDSLITFDIMYRNKKKITSKEKNKRNSRCLRPFCETWIMPSVLCLTLIHLMKKLICCIFICGLFCPSHTADSELPREDLHCTHFWVLGVWLIQCLACERDAVNWHLVVLLSVDLIVTHLKNGLYSFKVDVWNIFPFEMFWSINNYFFSESRKFSSINFHSHANVIHWWHT